jgi:hypothetical protein
MRRVAAAAVILVVFVFGAAGAAAQTFHGGLRGEVRDANGVLPGATVALVNQDTNIAREVSTNEAGQFNFSAVNPGTYTLKVSIQGYKTHESKDIRVGTQQFITLDVTLELGTIQESITVTGESPLIETSSASSGAVLDKKALDTLPAPGRAAFLIGVTVPTVVPTGDAQFNRQQDQTNASLLSLGGGGRRANNYMLDGVQITDMRNRASANPSIEALDEVAVQVHTYDAEMGRTGGGVFNTVAKSGTNEFHGAAFYQTRPSWGTANNYFQEKAGIPKPEGLYYRLAGGGAGGPVVKDRTFFWFASEGYRSNTTRNGSLRFPTEREKRGDFSQSFNAQGQLVQIFDPNTTVCDVGGTNCTRSAFPGNVIPPNRLNPVAANMASFFPAPQQDVSTGAINFRSTAEIIDQAEMYSGKVTHKFNDQLTLAGFYLYNNTDEPCANYWEPGLTGSKHFADPNDYLLQRRVHILAVNNTYVPSDNSVATFRVGWTRFDDNDTLTQEFDPASLGFNSAFVNAMAVKKFPVARIEGYGESGVSTSIGALPPVDRRWWSWSVNGSYSRFVGAHTLKGGADFRRAGLDGYRPGQASGDFRFDRRFTSSNPFSNGTATSGNAFASFLLGFPTAASDNLSFVPIAAPLQVFENYIAGYFQDDWRITSKFTINAGLRFEREFGLREAENRFTVAFDRAAASPLTVTIPADPVAGTPARQLTGGLRYAGQDGFPDHQGNPPAQKWAPRIGAVYAFNSKTVLRGGYGLFWAPFNYQAQSDTNYGQIGYTQLTFINQHPTRPTTSLDNPFPQGLAQPAGNSRGLLTGVGGGDVFFIDQEKGAPRVQQFSLDIQRELPGSMAVTFGYIGARGDDLNLGAESEGQLNINELDPSLLRLGSALNQTVPNPFFGNSNAGALATQATVQRRQLLRPYPQFGNVYMLQSTQGKSRYNAGIVKLTRRLSQGWGGTFSYTFSRLKDNQFAQDNFFSRRPRGFPLSAYDLDAEYGYSIIDVPHRLVLSPIVELPWGRGRKWLNQGGWTDVVFGGWTVSAIMNFESGFPIMVEQNDINHGTFSGTQRPNLTGTDPVTSGGREERFDAYIDPAAYSLAPAFTLGNAPRTDPNLRTPHRNNIDASFQKNFRLAGTLTAQFRAEILNLTNTVKVRGPEQRFGRSDFGLIAVQSGFMRLTQLSFRLMW